MNTRHWYVYKIGGGIPWFQHGSYDSAVKEAQRLIDTVGGEYEILEAKAVVKAAPKYVIEDLSETVQIMDEPEIEKWVKGSEICYGIHTPLGFINTSTHDSALRILGDYKSGMREWCYKDLTGFKREEEDLDIPF